MILLVGLSSGVTGLPRRFDRDTGRCVGSRVSRTSYLGIRGIHTDIAGSSGSEVFWPNYCRISGVNTEIREDQRRYTLRYSCAAPPSEYPDTCDRASWTLRLRYRVIRGSETLYTMMIGDPGVPRCPNRYTGDPEHQYRDTGDPRLYTLR